MDIVVAVDLNAEPAAVVDAAIGWAGRLEASVHLRTVSALQWHPDEVFGPACPLREEWDRRRRAEVEALLRLLDRVPPAMRGTAEVLAGPTAEAIAAAGRDADLVLCATRGRTGLRRMMSGSTSEEIVRASATPTLVLRLGTAVAAIPRAAPRVDRILVPVDPAAPCAEGLRVVSRWFPRASVTVVAVLERTRPPIGHDPGPPPVTAQNHPARDWAERALHALLADAAIEDCRVKLLVDETVGIGGCIASAAAGHDLVVVASRRQHGMAHLWSGSVAEQVVRLAPVPALIVAAGPVSPR